MIRSLLMQVFMCIGFPLGQLLARLGLYNREQFSDERFIDLRPADAILFYVVCGFFTVLSLLALGLGWYLGGPGCGLILSLFFLISGLFLTSDITCLWVIRLWQRTERQKKEKSK